MSSVSDPGQLSLTVASFTKAVIFAATLYAAVKGLDTATVTSQVQYVIDLVLTGVTAGLTVYHTVMTIYGIIRKLLHVAFAKPVLTVPAAVPTAVVDTSAS